jgi:hypothetical protein
VGLGDCSAAFSTFCLADVWLIVPVLSLEQLQAPCSPSFRNARSPFFVRNDFEFTSWSDRRFSKRQSPLVLPKPTAIVIESSNQALFGLLNLLSRRSTWSAGVTMLGMRSPFGLLNLHRHLWIPFGFSGGVWQMEILAPVLTSSPLGFPGCATTLGYDRGVVGSLCTRALGRATILVEWPRCSRNLHGGAVSANGHRHHVASSLRVAMLRLMRRPCIRSDRQRLRVVGTAGREVANRDLLRLGMVPGLRLHFGRMAKTTVGICMVVPSAQIVIVVMLQAPWVSP